MKQDDKLQARAIKFGVKSGHVVDSEEEAKRQARAARFGGGASAAQTLASNNGNKSNVRTARFINESGRIVVNAAKEPNQ